ncbi:MAG: hypothetical protein WD577_11665 [Bacteroidales bacterium]
MKPIKQQLFLSLIAGSILNLNACSNSNAEGVASNENVPVVSVSMTEEIETTGMNASPVKKELEKAQATKKAAFLVVTENGNTETEKAVSLAKEAKNIYKNAVVLEMNRDDAVNAELVDEWRLSGAPVPLILVFSPNGTLTGGRILNQATAENVAELVPSPMLEKVYAAIENNKNAIVVFSKKSFTDRSEVIKNTKEAVAKLNNDAVFIEVDLDDNRESGFMKQVRIDKALATESITLVINKQGQVAGTSVGIPDSDKLVTAANTPVRSGCGPGCGPAGCEQ